MQAKGFKTNPNLLGEFALRRSQSSVPPTATLNASKSNSPERTKVTTEDQKDFAAAIDNIVARYNNKLLWVGYSKDRLTKPAARVLIEQWSSFTRHSRQCWAFVVGNCPIVEVRKFIVAENLYEEEAQEGSSHFEILARMGIALA